MFTGVAYPGLGWCFTPRPNALQVGSFEFFLWLTSLRSLYNARNWVRVLIQTYLAFIYVVWSRLGGNASNTCKNTCRKQALLLMSKILYTAETSATFWQYLLQAPRFRHRSTVAPILLLLKWIHFQISHFVTIPQKPDWELDFCPCVTSPTFMRTFPMWLKLKTRQ